MKKKVLTYINILLGVISMALVSCHVNKKVTDPTPPMPMLKYGIPSEVIALYGVPVDYPIAPYEPTQTDTVAAPDTLPAKPVEQEEIILTKYGSPGSYKW